MELHHGLAGLQAIPPGGVVSIGNYDGMHLGHARLLETARSLRSGSQSGRIAVVTFEPHPLTVLRPELAPPRLTPPAIKQALLERAGVDDYVILPPAKEVLNLSAEDFWRILRNHVRPAHLVEGTTFHFGKGRQGTIEQLRRWCEQTQFPPPVRRGRVRAGDDGPMGAGMPPPQPSPGVPGEGDRIELHVVEPVTVALLDLMVAPVSSSLIRWLLAYGRARDAAICLGRPYALRGEIIRGFGRGRQLGVPTANLRCDDQLICDEGVYAARCAIDGHVYPVALSIGTLPTFERGQYQVEAHLLGFDGDLYGRTIEIEALDWLREQRKYAEIEPLKQQIARDIERVRRNGEMDPARRFAAVGS